MNSNIWTPMIIALLFCNKDFDRHSLNYINQYKNYEKYGVEE